MSKKKKWLIGGAICAGVLVLAGIGAGGFYFFTHMNQLAVSSEPYAESVAVYMGGESESGQTFSGKVEPEKQQKVYIDSEKGSIKKHTSKKAIRSKRAISFLSMRARIILTKLSKPICKLK